MKCLLKYQWIKLRRSHLPQGKGVMGHWAKLAARAAFRKGAAVYCGYKNVVEPGMWSGGIVGLKSILGVKSRAQAISVLQQLADLGYIRYTLDAKTKKLSYQIVDWVVKCSGAECMQGAVYATEGYGFLCIPRNITERLAQNNYQFEEADAWLDLWCHTVWQDPSNAFSFLAPSVQFGRYGAVLTLETLGHRWGWEKTKVWRFLQKYKDAFSLHRLPGSYGGLIFNNLYPTGTEVSLLNQADIIRIIDKIRILAQNTHLYGTDHERLNRMIAWYSNKIVKSSIQREHDQLDSEHRVAFSAPIIRAYFSLCWNCKNCSYDCKDKVFPFREIIPTCIRGPCSIQDKNQKMNQSEENCDESSK